MQRVHGDRADGAPLPQVLTFAHYGGMITFRCTAKLRRRLGLRDRDLSEGGADRERDWFADLEVIERRPCLLFTHAPTLYSFWVIDARKRAMERFNDLIAENLRSLMRRDGYSEDEIPFLLGSEGFCFAKTNSRSVLGSMRDFILDSRVYVEQAGGFAAADFARISDWLNRTPMSGAAPEPGLHYPIDSIDRRLRPAGRPRSLAKLD